MFQSVYCEYILLPYISQNKLNIYFSSKLDIYIYDMFRYLNFTTLKINTSYFEN